MTPDTLAAGIDAGGSHTTVVIVDARGEERARVEGPGSAVRLGDEAASAEIIMRLVRDAAGRAGERAIEALVVGAAGVGHAPAREAFAEQLRARGAPRRTHVVTDAEAAFASAFGDGPGVLVLSGTGSIGLARDPIGGWHRVGGWGWRVGDEGSGYAIGRAGVAAVGRALDGRGPATALREGLPPAAGVPDPGSIMVWARDASPRAIAALAAVVQDTARRGDRVSDAIVREAAADLVAHAAALAARFPSGAKVPVVFGGGALRPGSALRDAVGALADRAADVTVVTRLVDAGRGAALLALGLLSDPGRGPGDSLIA